MDQTNKTKPVPSATPSPNPYARDSSRRAIACVTCAKAKTRCDKALPSCSRCVSKGIKCDPRSTRRTSDNNYRALPTKKPFVAPKRFPTPSVLPSSTSFPSPRSIPSTRPRSIMRAPSHIDFRTAVKMSKQAAFISGAPKLTPLPTYHTQIVDDCYSYTPSPEPDLRFTPDIEQDNFPLSRGATPQTPSEPFTYNEPLPLIDTDYLDPQPWTGESLAPVGLGFADFDSLPQDNMWMTPTPEPEEMTQANLFAQAPMVADYGASWPVFQVPVHEDAECEGEGALDSGIVMQGEWMPQSAFVDMGSMVTAAYVPRIQGLASAVPVWEDVFMASSIPY